MSTTLAPARPTTHTLRRRGQGLVAVVLAAGIAVATAYGLLAEAPYRSVDDATVLAARAQDVCSVVVAVLLLALAPRRTPNAHLVRLGLLAYVAYSYAIYLVGLPMNRVFLVYVALVSVSLAALADGVVRLAPAGWARSGGRRLERGTGWMLVVVAVLFAGLWLSTLLPFALGGDRPDPEGPGGVPYPVFVLDLVVVLPCLAAVGGLLLRGHPLGGPLAVVALVKIVTLFTALWAGVVAGLLDGREVHLGPDAGPSLVMVALSAWLAARWLHRLRPTPGSAVRTTFWPGG